MARRRAFIGGSLNGPLTDTWQTPVRFHRQRRNLFDIVSRNISLLPSQSSMVATGAAGAGGVERREAQGPTSLGPRAPQAGNPW